MKTQVSETLLRLMMLSALIRHNRRRFVRIPRIQLLKKKHAFSIGDSRSQGSFDASEDTISRFFNSRNIAARSEDQVPLQDWTKNGGGEEFSPRRSVSLSFSPSSALVMQLPS